VLDGEVGDDPDALSNGDHRTWPDRLIALFVSNQPAPLSTRPPRAGIEVPQDEGGQAGVGGVRRNVCRRRVVRPCRTRYGRPGLAAALLGSQPYNRAAEWELPGICHSLAILAEVRASGGRKHRPLNIPPPAMAVSVEPHENADQRIDRHGKCILICRRQGLPGLPWCAGVPVRRACGMGTVPLAVELIEVTAQGCRGTRTGRPDAGGLEGLAPGWAACRPGACGPRAIRGREADASPESSSRPELRQATRTPGNVAVEPAGTVPGRRCTGGCGYPLRRTPSCYHAE
jgi:hypothetical protein